MMLGVRRQVKGAASIEELQRLREEVSKRQYEGMCE